MRRLIAVLAAFGMFLGLALVSRAGGDETSAIIDKAIAAHGLKGKADKNHGYRGKNKGTLHVMGLDLEFTQEVTIQIPDKFKEVMDLSVMGQQIGVVSVFDGKQGWIKANGKEIKVENEILNEFKEAAYAMSLAQGLFLKDKGVKLSLLGEVQVKGRPTVGIKVSKEGHKELDFYFDKATGLIAKLERRARDFQAGQEVTEERIITEYQDVEGRKVAKKVEVLRDGKSFLEAEVLEVRFFDRIEDSEFARPE
jgi:hypothetical protein